MNKMLSFATFAIGAAIGSVTTWYLIKKKYERIAQEEIDSVKEAFARMKKERKASDDQAKPTEDTINTKPTSGISREKPNISDYAKMLNNTGYTDYSKVTEPKDEEETASYKPPYVVSPDEFGEYDDYERISLMYYADHVLTDDDDEPIEDIEATVGIDSLSHFGEYEDDAVYVRNERLKVDYEILKSLKTYSEVLEQKPYLRRN